MTHRWQAVGAAALLGASLAAWPTDGRAELKVGVSGYIKLDVQYSDKLTGSFPSPAPSDTPLDSNTDKDHSQTIIDARQSRLRATFSDDIAGVKTSGRIEADFFNGEGTALTSNSRNFRLRHAFVRGEHSSGFFVLAGQTWSLFMNSEVAQPDLVDFNGPAGQIFARQPQLRVGYTVPLGPLGDLLLEADVEKHSVPDFRGTAAAPTAAAASVDTSQGEGQDVPLVAGKVTWLGKPVKVEAAFAWARNRAILTGGVDTDENAWAAEVSAEVTFGPVTLFGHYHHVDGLGRLANGDFPTAFLLGTSIENVETDGWYAGATYHLTKNTAFTGVYGYHKADRNAGFGATALEKHQSIHANVIHKFWERWQVGLEYRRFDVDAFDGQEGDVNSVFGAVWYFF